MLPKSVHSRFIIAAKFKITKQTSENIARVSKSTIIFLFQLGKQECDQGCMTSLDCCLTSNPCLYGGKCKVAKQHSGQRFVCKCPNGYHGYRCEKRSCSPGFKGINCDEPIRSCRDYSNSGVPGYYTIALKKQNTTRTVFCDFSSNTTWTLIQSYSFENRDKFQVPFFTSDRARSVRTLSWKDYSLSKLRMKIIMSDSTKWRFTCNYDINGTVYIDYVTGLTKDLDLINFDGRECVKVKYINVRGWSCTECMVFMVQSQDIPFHMDVSQCGNDFQQACDHGSAVPKLSENSFGYYRCFNKKHRCASSLSATTQVWFGA